MAVDKKVLYSFGGGKVKEVSGLLIDPATGEISTGAKITVTSGGIDITGSALLKSGAAITNADLTMGGRNITGLPSTPSGDTAAASKAYVDAQFAAIGSNSHVYTMDNTTAGIVVGDIVAMTSGGVLEKAGIGETANGPIGIVTLLAGTTGAQLITVTGDGYAKTKTDISALANGALVYLAADGAVSGSVPAPSSGVTNQIVIAGYVVDKGTGAGNGYIHLQLRPFGLVTG